MALNLTSLAFYSHENIMKHCFSTEFDQAPP